MIKRLLVMLLALVLLFGGLFGWKFYQISKHAAMASQPPPPATVASAKVKAETWRPTLNAVGNVVAIQGVNVSNELEGQVEAILFQSGNTVKKGDPLLRLNDSVDQAELQGLIAERQLALARLRRVKKLLQDKTISQSDYDEAQAAWESARAQVISQKALINKKSIRAPFAGVLGIREVNIGQYLAAGSTIVSLQALQPIYIDYSLPDRHLAQLTPGQKVVAHVNAYPDLEFTGKIETIDSRVDEGTRNVRVRAVLENGEQKLKPGMFARVETLLPQERRVLTLPHTAITYNPYGDSVFVINETQSDNGPPKLVAQRRQVQTGEVRGERIEITQGLEAGQQVVSAGQIKLRSGQPVQIDNSVALDMQTSSQ
jgi:membrane fusion protein (multidrug efflux system)